MVREKQGRNKRGERKKPPNRNCISMSVQETGTSGPGCEREGISLCKRVLSPVCGRGVTFMNRCFSEREGICDSKDGECGDGEERVRLAVVSGGVIAGAFLCCFLVGLWIKCRSDRLLSSATETVVHSENEERRRRGRA